MMTQIVTLLPFMVCLNWAVVLFFDYLSERTAVRVRLLFFMLAATVLYGGHYVFFMGPRSLQAANDVLYGMANLAVYPLYLLYIIVLTNGQFRWQHRLILVPALLCGITYAVCYMLMGEAELAHFIDEYIYKDSWINLHGVALFAAYAHLVCRGVFLLLVLVVLWQGFYLLRHFQRRVSSVYADTEGRTLRPVSVLLQLFVVTSMVSACFGMVGKIYFYDYPLLLGIPSLLFSSLLFCIGYVGSKPMFSYVEYNRDQNTNSSTEEHNVATPSDKAFQLHMEELAQNIEKLMSEENFFLRPDLRLQDVAKRLNTNDKYVSIAINQVLGQPFADYINRRRIAYARDLQKKHPTMSVTEVAHRSGYVSLQSFYRNQKRWT